MGLLRLRSYVLRERLQWGLWKARHLPGSELASDLLTKPVTSPSAWQKFYDFMGMVVNAGQKLEDEVHFPPKLCKKYQTQNTSN